PRSFLKALRDRSDLIEYRQANLSNPIVVSKCFSDSAPNGLLYTHVLDITGELVPNRPAEVYIQRCFRVPLLIARAAAAQRSRDPESLKAYIRFTGPFYNHPDVDKRYKESDPDGWKPRGPQAVWWHEILRTIGSIEELPLVVLRSGLVYGPGNFMFEATALTLLGLVYKNLGRDMQLLWSPDLPKTCMNSQDIAGVVWRAAEWISTLSRKEADAIAGSPIPPSYDPSVTPENCPDALPASMGPVIIPTFNLADEGDATQAKLSAVISRVFGINATFLESSEGLFDGKTLGEIIEEATEVHLNAWNEIITTSNPPVPDTPLSPYMPPGLIMEHGCAMDGERIKKASDRPFRYPRFDENAIHDYVNWCREDGIWPETNLYTG
ncbi:hypothetical protein M408DRAFT_83116, partial [Serendipita vermifera MAFF 305830]